MTQSPYTWSPGPLKRFDKLGDLFAPVLTTKQRLPEKFVANLKVGSTPKTLKTSATETAVPRRSRQDGRRRFVIQKHAASHLHYDFRLEMHGVLKSWAVPKGVPYSLEDRRLAMATEDHPIEYLDFEGTIPAGQYGGGTVMVRDIGTYELIEGNYYKGRLHVHLAGKKLKGEWILEKDSGKGARSWVMRKAGKPMKPLTAKHYDTSALTGRIMRQIAEANDRQWQSHGARA